MKGEVLFLWARQSGENILARVRAPAPGVTQTRDGASQQHYMNIRETAAGAEARPHLCHTQQVCHMEPKWVWAREKKHLETIKNLL